MFEPRRMVTGDIEKLLLNIVKDEELKNWNLAEFQKTLKDDTRILYILGDIGFLEISNNYDEAEIYMIWIAPDYRNQGLGQKLLGFMLNEIAQMNIKKIFLEVAINNQSAIKLYEKNHFKICGHRKNYYRKNDNTYIDAHIMAHEICKNAI